MQNETNPSDAEVAAALAAVQCYLAEQTAAPQLLATAHSWNSATVIEAQGLPPSRNGSYRGWGQIDRAARAARWSYGITGV